MHAHPWHGVSHTVFIAVACLATGPASGEPPYPPSPVIAGVELDWSTHLRAAPGSDNWPITWADDGHQYTVWGDGGGFGGTNDVGRVSLGVARVEGDLDDYRGRNVWGGADPEHPAAFGGKSYGIACVDSALYMWVGMFEPKKDPFAEVRLARSADHGAAWELAEWAWTKSDGVVLPTFCQFGPDYTGAPDEYVYVYMIRYRSDAGPDPGPGRTPWLTVQRPGAVDLARVVRDRVMERGAYEFWTGLDEDGRALWSNRMEERRPVFEDPAGVGWNVSVSYNAGLRRYLLCTEHADTHKGMLGVFDAPEPWGPWTTVCYEDAWGEGRVPLTTFYWSFSNKWASADGVRFALLFTGLRENDSWNSIEGSFVLR